MKILEIVSEMQKDLEHHYLFRLEPKSTEGIIKKVVVLCMENRSFDHIFGYMDGVNGIKGKEDQFEVEGVKPCAKAQYIQLIDLSHEVDDHVEKQLKGEWISDAYSVAYKQLISKRWSLKNLYLPPEKLVKIEAETSQEFCVFDSWHSSLAGPTHPNRWFLHCGTSDGVTTNTEVNKSKIIFDLFEDDEWKIYYHDISGTSVLNLNMLKRMKDKKTENIEPFHDFYKAAKDGNLPKYSFLEPCFFTSGDDIAQDQHPPHDMRPGEQLILDIYTALLSNEKQFEETLFLIDHVQSPSLPKMKDKVKNLNDGVFSTLGYRVPAISINPYIKKGTLDSRLFDHCSVPATLTKLFCLLECLSERVFHANTFDDVLNLSKPRKTKEMPDPFKLQDQLNEIYKIEYLNKNIPKETIKQLLENPRGWIIASKSFASLKYIYEKRMGKKNWNVSFCYDTYVATFDNTAGIIEGSISTTAPYTFKGVTNCGSNCYMGNSISDPMMFNYYKLTGDGYITFKLTYDKVPTYTYQEHFVVGIREGIALNEKMVSFAVKGQVGLSSSNKWSKFLFRTSVNSVPTVEMHKNPMLDELYHGYIKLERVGNKITAYISDDLLTWISVHSYTLSTLPQTAHWTLGLNPAGYSASQNTAVVSNLRFYGFNTTCGSGNYYLKDTETCTPIVTHNECGDNSWRFRILSATTSSFDQLFDIIPTLTVDPNELTMVSQMTRLYNRNLETDQFVMAFKKLSGDGTIITKIKSMTSTIDTFVSGVVIRQDLVNLQNVSPLMAFCGHPSHGRKDFIFQFRDSPNSQAAILKFTQNPKGGYQYYVKLTKTGNTIECSHSNENGVFSQTKTTTIGFVGNFYVGVAQGADDDRALTTVFNDISITGFSGFCNDRGNCITKNGQLDKCDCSSPYFGDYCEFYNCTGISNNETNVCSSHGSCIAPETCNCTSGYVGSDCQFAVCFGVYANNTNVCSSHGLCNSPDVCSCSAGYSGMNCEFPVCFEKISFDPLVCSGKGMCTGPDSCSCGAGSTGSNCEIPMCNSLTDPNACSGSNGTCISTNSCNCTSGYAGTNCEYFSCFGISSNEATVCSSHGSCVNSNICACDEGYTGSECKKPICFGKTEPQACSSTNGTCMSTNNCSCALGHTGNECQFIDCFGISSNDSNVCNSHGTCQNPNSCICDSQFTGSKCDIPICFGFINPVACSGPNGTCISHNTCSCSSNHGGSQCQIPKCFGILGNESNVCNSQGNCFSVDSCHCNSKYSGDQCQNPICYGIESSQTNTVCSGNGTCSSPDNCICNSGYYGTKCDIFICDGKLSNDSTVCNSHGSCIGKENCFCDTGYLGQNCELNICNGKSSGDITVCSSHGSCISPNNCICESGWTGNNCQDITCVDRNSCSGNGICIGANNCNCNTQFTGLNCSFPICHGIGSNMDKVCSGNGICSSPDNCVCSAGGYSGIYCNVTVCTDVNDCSGNGLCIGANNCSCSSGWENSNCSTFHCKNENNCSGVKGNCVGPNSCSCTPQWSGTDCNSPVCFSKSALDANVCSGNGNCVSPDSCSCNSGWTGNNCQNAICNHTVSTNPNVCNKRGNCLQPNNCSCAPGYTGNDCQFTICYGVSNEFLSVCSGHGSCNTPEICSCLSSYSGFNCEIPICFGKAANETNSCTNNIRGNCLSPNNCTCAPGYSGNECQNNICFGIDSINAKVCSSHGNCTEKDTCICQPSFYGRNCQHSDLFEFVDHSCQIGCSINKTLYKECIDIGPSCYCNKEVQSTRVSCDSSFRITGMKFSNVGFSGIIPNMLNFTSLENVDLSSNELFRPNKQLQFYFSPSLKTLNLSYNENGNSASNYEIFKSYFTNFDNLVLDGNKLCGIFPETWLKNEFSVSTKNHQKSIWCDDLNTDTCGKLPLTKNTFTLLPHETSIILNYTTSAPTECKTKLIETNIHCLSSKFDFSSSKEFSKSSASFENNEITCLKNEFFADIDQYLTIVWKYNSTLSEKISTDLHVINLPYATISNIDPRLINIQESGTIEITLETNQNITRYRKNPTDKIYCQHDDGTTKYFVEAYPIVGNESFVKCSINNDPNIKEPTITLYESTKLFLISNSLSFSFIKAKLLNPEISSFENQQLLLRNSDGNQINGYNGHSYSLSNSNHSIHFPCSVSNGKIISCNKLMGVPFSYQIEEVTLQFKDGSNLISEIQTIFFQRNGIQNIYPRAILSNIVTDVYVTFNSSTFNSTIQNMKIYCVDEVMNANFSGSVINSTTMKCNAISNDSSISYNFKIIGIYKDFKVDFNAVPVDFHVIKQNLIYPSNSITSMNGTKSFEFSFTETISKSIANSLECHLSDNRFINAVYVSSNEFKCIFDSNEHQNLTFWFKNQFGIRSKLSSNSVSLYFLKFDRIEYNSTSSQFGNTGMINTPIISIKNSKVPSYLYSQVKCEFDGSLVPTVYQNENELFSCSISTNTPGYKRIGIKFIEPNSFKIPEIHNTFKNRINLTYSTPNILNINYQLKVHLSTSNLISNGKLKSNCDDLIVTFKGMEIPRYVSNCNSASTLINFKVQESTNGSITDYQLFYGNEKAIGKSIESTTNYGLIPNQILNGDESILKLSSNQLEYGFLKTFLISKIDPVASLVSNSSVKIWNNYQLIDYQQKIKFVSKLDDSIEFNSHLNNSLFTTDLYSTNGAIHRLSLWVIYLPTGQYIQASSNTIQFIFMEKIELENLYPFVDRFSMVNEKRNSSVSLRTNSGLFTDEGLYCKYEHNGIIQYSKAKFISNSNTNITCLINVNQLNSSTEFVSIDLFMKVSTEDTNFNYVLSSNNITYVYLKEPIQMDIPMTITKHYLNQSFNLNFENGLKLSKYSLSYLGYKIKLKPEFDVENPSKYISCDFTKVIGKCKITELTLTHTPMRLDFEMEVISLNSTSNQLIKQVFNMTSNYFRENITFVYEKPFAIDANLHETIPKNISFKIDKKLHPNFSFYCKINSASKLIEKDLGGNLDLFSCDLNTRGIEENVTISLCIRNSGINGIDGSISTEDSTIQVVKLKYIDEFTSKTPKNHTISKFDSTPFVIPQKYQDYQFGIGNSNSIKNIYNCTMIDGACMISTSSSAELPTNDIVLESSFMNYQNGSFFDKLIDINQGLLVYENHEIAEIFPLAGIEGDDLNITLKFDARATKNSLTEKIQYFCEFFNRNSSEATKIDDKTLRCPIQFGQHLSNVIQFKSFLRIPQLSGEKNIYLTLNDSLSKFRYLSKKNIEFSDLNQIKFYFTSTLISFRVNITTYIPLELTKYFKTRLSDSSGFSLTTNFTGHEGNEFTFDSTTLTNVGGKKEVSLWYKENDYEFQLSNNTLELIFAVPSLITGLTPSAVVVNRTTQLTISSAFDTSLDYGLETIFECRYGRNESRYEKSSIATIINQFGSFRCEIDFELEGKIFVSIWIKSQGLERKMTLVDESLLIIDSNFLSPSIGFLSGKENVQIIEYKNPESNVTFQDDILRSKYSFECSKSNNSLHCLTPKVSSSDISIFQSYPLTFNSISKNLSVPFIYHEKVEILEFSPRIISSDVLNFPINISMNKEIKINEGSLFFVLSPETNERKDFDFGNIQNKKNVSKLLTFQSHKDGIFKIQLFYQNPFCIEFRNMFAISSSKNITFTGKSSIELISETNLFKKNIKKNITIKFTDISKLHLSTFEKESIKCKLGNSFIPTILKSNNEFVCSVISSEVKSEIIQLYYVNENAYGNEILLSTNTIDILFIDEILTESILPFSSNSTTQNIYLKSNYSNIYGNSVTYKCVFGNNTSIATLSNGIFNCVIDKTFTGSYSSNISLLIESNLKKTHLSFSKNSQTFYFMNQIELLSISGHAEKFKTFEAKERTVRITLKDDLITNQNVFCKIISNDGISFSKVYIDQNEGKNISCKIQKETFLNLIEIIDIGLFMNSSNVYFFDLSSNIQSYLFIKDDIKWKTSKVIEPNSLSTELIFTVPNRISFNYELNVISDHMNNQSNLVSCDFILGLFVKCNLPKDYLELIQTIPTKLMFKLKIIQKYSIELIEVNVDFLYYYHETDFQHLKPHYISYNERLNYPLRLVGNTLLNLDSQNYQFYCNITQNASHSILVNATFDLNTNEYQNSLNKSSHFICSFNSFGLKNQNYKLNLLFQSENGIKQLTKNESIIYVFEKGFELDTFYGTNLGGYEIGRIDYSNLLPTKNYLNYKYSLKFEDRNKEIEILQSDFSEGGFTFTMIDISKYYSSWNTIEKRMKLNLYIDSIRSISFYPHFTFYQITIDSISPTNLVKLNSKTMLYFKIKEKFNQKFQISVKYINEFNEIQQETCKMNLENIIQCLSPSYDKLSDVRVLFSINLGSDYDGGMKLRIYNDESLKFKNVTPSIVSAYSKSEISISGNYEENINSTNIIVRYSNYRDILEFTNGFLKNENTIISNSPSFYLTNIDSSSMKIQIDVSFDNGVNFEKTNLTVDLSTIDVIRFSPLLSPENVHFSIKIENLPSIHLKSHSTITLALISSIDQNMISLLCDTNYQHCNSTNVNEIKTGKYELYLLIDKDKTNIKSDQFIIYETPIFNSVSPSMLFHEMKNPIHILGSKFLVSDAIILIKESTSILSTVSTYEKKIPLNIKNSDIFEFELPIIPSNVSSIQIKISFNSNNYYHDISKITLLNNPILDSVSNLDSILKDSTGFSFRDSKLELTGKNFIFPGSSVIIRIKNQLITKEWISGFTVENDNLITFDLPSIDKLGISVQLQYPVSFQFGISFNNGFDFIEKELLYLDKYTTLLLYQVNPKIIQRKSQILSIQGIGFEYVDKCQIISGKNIIFETNTTKTGSTNVVNCNITDSNMLVGNSILMTVSNIFNDTSNSFEVFIYDDPTATKFSFSSGLTIGGYNVGVFIENLRNFTVFCKFGSIDCERACVIKNSSYIECYVTAYPTGSFKFAFGYNQIHYIKSNLTFTFIPCNAGHTANNYSSPCYPCPSGTFKLTKGLYGCQECPENTFTNETGTLTCQNCPKNKVSKKGSNSISNCVCDIGFYKNPLNPDECFECPVGGICTKTNLSIPTASPGYWYSLQDINSFYLCTPKVACGGGLAENCTKQYNGLRCGYCSVGYYKSKNKCYACGDAFTTVIKLFILLRSLFAGLIGHKIVDALGIKYKRPPEYTTLMTRKQELKVKWNISSDEDSKLTMNQILENLFSIERAKRKLYLITRKGKRVAKKVEKVKSAIPANISVNLVPNSNPETQIDQTEHEYYQAHRNFLENLPNKKK
eukprot:gene3602-6336_t